MVSYKNIDRYALISVYNKTNLNFLCKILQKYKIGIISTGSTHDKIKNLGYKSLQISKITNSKEILDLGEPLSVPILFPSTKMGLYGT